MKKLSKSIILCEDDINLASVVKEYLINQGYSVTHALNGVEGISLLRDQSFDLCLLDVMMPEMDGLELLRELRESGNTTPVIIISQRGSKEDIIAGYQAGCDDYMVKPCSMEILVCKIEAILHRILVNEENQATVFQLGHVTYDAIHQTLGQQRLSGRENDLLLMLSRKQNTIVERSQILKVLWKEDNYFTSRSLSVFINRLRKFLAKIAPEVRIVVSHGKGYKLVVDND